jgi:hypothetical protein
VRSKATTLLNLEAGYHVQKNLPVNLSIFNLANSTVSDMAYFASRLPGDPAGGLDDLHTHPSPPRTAGVGLVVGF